MVRKDDIIKAFEVIKKMIEEDTEADLIIIGPMRVPEDSDPLNAIHKMHVENMRIALGGRPISSKSNQRKVVS